MKRFRTYSYIMVLAVAAAQAVSAATAKPPPPSNPAADALIEQLRTGTNAERIDALRKLCESGAAMAPSINKAWADVAPVRPALPRSFARTLRANIDGERDLYAASTLVASFPGAFTVVNGKVAQNSQTVIAQFNELQRTKPFAAVAAGKNDADIILQLSAYPFIPILSTALQDSVASLIYHKNDVIRHAALSSLAYFARTKVMPDQLLPLLNSNDPLLSGPAAIILARQGDDPKLVELLAVAKSDPAKWDAMAELLGFCDRAQAGRFLKALLDDSDWHVRLFSSGCLLALKENTSDAEKTLLDLFACNGHEMKLEAAWILYELGSADTKKDVIKKLYEQRKTLSQVYLGVSDWLGRKPEIKKKAEAAAASFVNTNVAAGRLGQFMVSGQTAIDFRDAVRLGLGEKVKTKLSKELGNLIDMPPPAPVGKAPTKVIAKNTDRYVYSIMATVLSELDPAEYKKQIARCVEVIRSRQLGSGMWSYRDPTDQERDDYKDGYTQAQPSDFELPQAFYAVCGLESAKVHGEIPVDTEIFMKALRGILYTQNLDGGFSNYPQPSPRVVVSGGRPDLAAWGLGVVAICLRNGMLDIEQEPDLLARAFIGREAARQLLARHAAAKAPAFQLEFGGLAGAYPLRELAFTFGNDGLMSASDYAALERPSIYGGATLYTHGYPEPPDSTSPPWVDEPVIEIKSKATPKPPRPDW